MSSRRPARGASEEPYGYSGPLTRQRSGVVRRTPTPIPHHKPRREAKRKGASKTPSKIGRNERRENMSPVPELRRSRSYNLGEATRKREPVDESSEELVSARKSPAKVIEPPSPSPSPPPRSAEKINACPSPVKESSRESSPRLSRRLPALPKSDVSSPSAKSHKSVRSVAELSNINEEVSPSL